MSAESAVCEGAAAPVSDFIEGALQAVRDERMAQFIKWGVQDHDLMTWATILTEEVGEFAEAALHNRFGGPAADSVRKELVQVAAVAVQIIEMLDEKRARLEGMM